MTAGELASSEGIMPAQSRDVVVVGWTGTLDDSDFIFRLSFSMLWSHCSLCFWDVSHLECAGLLMRLFLIVMFNQSVILGGFNSKLIL